MSLWRPFIAKAAATALIGLFCSWVGAAPAAASAAVIGAGSAASSPARSAANPAGPAWSALTPAQRSALAPLEHEWPGIDAPGKAKWLRIAPRFPSLPADEQQRMHDRMAEWSRLTPAERGRARLSFQEARQLSPQQRHERWETYQALPDDARKALAERAKPRTEKSGSAAAAASAAGAAARPKLAASRPAALGVKPVSPTSVQVQPGATTTLMTRQAKPPAHQPPGPPKIIAGPDKVDRATLLPRSGPQRAPARATAASSAPPQQP